ncbi:MAG: GtrA family protein [Clostridia bacterium]|jgi:putative flippase GtrA|nr:GtrA family protein [Clostridia bacterium]MBQ2324871.1 GtrA family protein [Clostridia bacterium]MBR6776342.1 GtrA family protein [Clostridia bacterium]
MKKIIDLLFRTEKGKYLVVGGLTTLVSFIAFWIAFYPLGLNDTVSTVIKNIAGIAFAYIPNRIWVFDSKNKTASAVSKESVLFFVTRIGVMLLDMVFMAFLPSLLSFLPYSSMIATVISSVLCLILNYIAGKILIFTNKEKK